MSPSRRPAAVAGALSDGELRRLLAEDAERGWRAFVDQYTPALLAYIERAGIRDRDEAMELYVLVCERLTADDCARLRRHDPAKGALGAWLAVLVRNVVIDWVRSRAGRRRLFGSIKNLGRLDQRVFELFFWDNRTVAEIAGLLQAEFESLALADVFDALERVQSALTERQRVELVAMAARSASAVSLDATPDAGDRPLDVEDPTADIEGNAQTREAEALLERALAALPAEDAAIARLKYGEGLSLKQIRQALHLDALTADRIEGILATLKSRFSDQFSPSIQQSMSPGLVPEGS